MYLGVVFLEGRWILATSRLARASWACFLELSRDMLFVMGWKICATVR
jgi:hypothetical protein